MPRLFPSLPVLAAGLALFLAPDARAQALATSPAQLDRIEGKLDEILRRLDQIQSGPVSRPVPGAGTQDGAEPSIAQVDDKPGALAMARPAPPLSGVLTVPADSVGGFVYEGGPVRLDDLAARGLRYHGQAGIEVQGWLRVTQTGRYQLGAEFASSRTGIIGALSCGVALWLEDRQVGQQAGELTLSASNPAPLSLVLGAELQPGLYKLRLWTACGRMSSPIPVTATVLIKTPSDLNLRPLVTTDVVHQER